MALPMLAIAPIASSVVTGDAELAHDDHIEDGAQRSRDGNGDGYAASRQRQHDHVASGVRGQPLVGRQDGSGVRAIDVRLVAHRSILTRSTPVVEACGSLRGR